MVLLSRAYTTRLQVLVAKAMDGELAHALRVEAAVTAIEEAKLQTFSEVLWFFTDGDPKPLEGHQNPAGVIDVLADALAAANDLRYVPGIVSGG